MQTSELYKISQKSPFIIAGPCVLESESLVLETAEELKKISIELDLPLFFKGSFDKANRSSINSFRGLGVEKGLSLLAMVKEKFSLPVVTDIHLPEQAEIVAEVVDVLQIPAFLCRQTDLLLAAAATGKIVNVKKGQFLSPLEMKNIVDKVKTANHNIWLTERGNSFGYNNLVVDFRSIPIMQENKVPVILDATHAVQLPGALGGSSGGDRQYVRALARAAAAVGCDGIFLEVHPDPDKALCDGANSIALKDIAGLLKELKALWSVCS